MSNKPRMVRVTGADVAALIAGINDIQVPAFYQAKGSLDMYADADELRAWRESQNTSEGVK